VPGKEFDAHCGLKRGEFWQEQRQHFRSDFGEKRELIQILGPRVWEEERGKNMGA
jgi:hypothetical protein